MKQILSLWDACPQGGKHRRSVFLRLLLLVCMLATASAGWADETLFSMTVKNTISSTTVYANNYLALNTTDHLDNLTGSITLYADGSDRTMLQTQGTTDYKGCINLSASNNVYVKITLSKGLQAGDIITSTAPTNQYVAATTGAPRATTIQIKPINQSTNTALVIGNTVATGKDLIGATEIYLWKGGGNTYLHSLTITRPTSVSAPTFSPASGSLKQNAGTVTATSATSGSTVYYKWSSNSTAETFTYASYSTDGWTAGTADDATATATAPDAEGTYYLNAVAYKDGEASTVSNQAYTIDGTAPTLSSSTPEDGATGVATSGTIVLTFNEAIASVDATKFSLSPGTKGTVAIDNLDNTKVNIAYSGLANNTPVTLTTVAGAVEDAAGNASAALDDISFTTEAAAVVVPVPTVSYGGNDYTANHTSAINIVSGTNVTITASTGYKIKYKWSSAAATPSDWNDTNAASYVTSTATTGDRYLHVKAYEENNTSNESTSFYVKFNVTAANVAPSITVNPVGASYTVGATTVTPLSITASGGTGTLSYQWYSNTSSSTSSGTAIDGETNASYTPPVSSVGTTYYYCKVTDQASATATSTAAAVTVRSAAQSPVSNPATQTYASKTFLDVSGTEANASLEDNTQNFVSYGAYHLVVTMKPGWMSSQAGNSSASYSYANATKEGFLPITSPASFTSGYGRAEVKSGGGIDFYVTGTTGIAILAKDNGTDKKVQLSVYEVASDGTETSAGTPVLGTDKANPFKLEFGTPLNASKYYKVTVDGTTSDKNHFYQIRFTKGTTTPATEYAITCNTASNGSIASNLSEAAAGARVTITATPDDTYELSTLTVTKAGGGTVSVSGSGNTRTFTMPDVAVTVTATFTQIPSITTTYNNLQGTVSTSPANRATAGTTVTITATPANGYALDAITVTTGNPATPITVTNNQFTMPSTDVTVSATFVEKQVGTGDRWNFTTMNSSDDARYQSSAAWSSTTTNGRTVYQNSFSASTGEYAQVNSDVYATTDIEQIYNMKFRRVSGGSMSTNTYKIFKPSSASATDGYLQLNATNLSITLQGLTAGEQLTIYYSGSSTKGFTLTNASAENIIGENTSAKVTVTADGDVEIKTESSGFKIYKIERGTVVDVADPTFSLADGTEQSTGTVSVTIESQQAADGGTVTTHYAFSNAPMTRAAIIAANTNFVGAKGTTQVVNSGAATQADIVLNAVTKYEKGGNTYYSEVVTATYPYTGTRTTTLTVDHLDIQQGEERTLKPVFKYNDGTLFDPTADDIHSSINDYFTFTFTKNSNSVNPADQDSYISVDGNGVVKTKDASGTKATVGTEAVFTVTATQKSGWNESTDGKWPFDQTYYTFNQATIKVVAKETGFHMTFYWDPEYKQQVDPSEYSLGTGDESSVTIFSEKMYNGRMIYAKPDEGYTIYVAAGINSGSVSNVSSNSKKDGVNYYKYTYNDPMDEYPDAPIEFNGMPILIEDEEWGSSDTEKFFYLNVHTYNNSTKTFEGSPVKAKFTVLNNNSRRPSESGSPISLEPSTATNPLSTAQTVAVVGAEGAYVYGKFSTSNKYTTPNLINEKGVLGGVSSVAVFSTEVAGRKISATQVLKNADGYYYIGGQVNLTYTYRFATELNLTKNSLYTNVVKSGDDAQTIILNDLIQSITYYNKDEKKDIDITSTQSNNGGTTATQKETVTYAVEYRNGAGGEGGTTVENGVVNIGAHSGQVIITFTYPGGTYKKTVNKKEGLTAEAKETFTIYITDPLEQIPNITPTTRNFTDEQAVRVQAPKDWNTLYMIQKPTYDPEDTEHKNPIYDNVTYISSGEQKNCSLLKKGEFVMLTLTESARVRAFAYDQNEFTENHEPTSTGTHTSKEVYETYTKLAALQAPVLSPSGNPHVRTTKDLTVNVTLKDAISGLEVYYTTDGTDPTPTTGELFNGSEKIKVSGASTTVKAIAYDPATGRISPITTGVYVYTGDIDKPGFRVKKDNQSTWSEPHYEGTVVVGPNDRVMIEGPEGSTLYYTLDGSTPTPGASREYDVNDTSAPFLIMKNTTGRALAILDDASSPVTTVEFVLESDLENLWEAVEETTPGGKMANDDRYVVYGKQTGNSSTKAVKYLTATFGGMDNTGWGHADISESTKGTPLDGIGNYSIRNVIDAWDESGKEPKNSSTLLHERTFKLPAQGDMVRFEPERDGQLTIWLLQQGGLNYTDDGEFCDAFMRLRPVYLFDEQGNSIPVSENRGIKSSTRLSSNWDKLQGVDKWTPKDEKQLGVTNIYYTKEESNKIYAMYNNYLDGKGAGDAIAPFEVPDGDVKNLLSDLGLTGHGYVMPSGGYVRYNFDVQGGKTYYLFGFRTKLGVRGFRFQPSDGQDVETISSPAVTMANDGTDATSVFTGDAATKICKVTYSRAFTQGVWAGIVLPFSVSRTQLQKVFGESVDVLHLDKTTESSIDFKRHWYPMIVAGTPVLIKPSKTISSAVFDGVHYEASSVTDVVPETGNYKMTGAFTGSNLKKGDYYVSNSGAIMYLKQDANGMYSCRSWLTPKATGNARADLGIATFDAFAEDEWNVAGNPQPFVQKEDVVTYINGVEEDGIINNGFNGPTNIYTISGQLVRQNSTSLEGLPKGIYIVNGKKVAVK